MKYSVERKKAVINGTAENVTCEEVKKYLREEKKSNTKDNSIILIKKILDEFMKNHCEKHGFIIKEEISTTKNIGMILTHQ